MKPMNKTAVVILNWNGAGYLKKFMPLLEERTPRDRAFIVVADNGSTDDSLTYLEKHHPGVLVIRFDRNYGFAGGYNRALQQIEARYYVLLNSDIEVTGGWLDPLTRYMDQHPGMAACQPVILDYRKNDRYEYAGAAGGFIDRYGYTFCRGRIFDAVEEFNPDYQHEGEIFWATGACLMVRPEAFHGAGGFDEDFFAHMEEVDLCWRLKNQGYTIGFQPGSRVYHVGGGSLPRGNPFKTYLNFRNNLFLLYKNLPRNKRRTILFTRMLLDLISMLLFLFRLRGKEVAAVGRAHRDFYRHRRRYKELSKTGGGNQKTINFVTIYTRSIVVEYFLRGNRLFRQLDRAFVAAHTGPGKTNSETE